MSSRQMLTTRRKQVHQLKCGKSIMQHRLATASSPATPELHARTGATPERVYDARLELITPEVHNYPTTYILQHHPRTACPNWRYPRTGVIICIQLVSPIYLSDAVFFEGNGSYKCSGAKAATFAIFADVRSTTSLRETASDAMLLCIFFALFFLGRCTSASVSAFCSATCHMPSQTQQ